MKKLMCSILALAMVLSMVTLPASAVGGAPSTRGNVAQHWFYDQLSAGAKAIYNALWDMYDRGMMKDGQTSYDLADEGVVTQREIAASLDGDRTLFNDFAAAKDAFDLEHPEVWYMDSSYLSFRVTQDTAGKYHAYMGPGRGDDYYVSGVKNAADVDQKTRELNAAIAAIVSGAQKAASGSSDEAVAKRVRYVHDQITKSISYRFEDQCKAENVGYLRTTYGLVTHEGVCEAYARSMQMVLNELGIPCVLVCGLQTSDGNSEAHMWNEVMIGGNWYVVDATWDDPIVLDSRGNIKTTGVNGLDGGERTTYLLVGRETIGGDWRPTATVSSGSMEFEYPDIAAMAFGTSMTVESGLTVISVPSMMGDVDSTVYQISYNGDGLVEAAKKGYYFLVKMYDLNADGSMEVFDDWYYMVHGLHSISYSFDPNNDFRDTGNPDYHDGATYLTMNVSNAEYVEFAVTTTPPPAWKDAMDLFYMGGYYEGNGRDIVTETGLIYNERGNYEQAPYPKNVYPVFSSPAYVGTNYTIHIEFTDPLYHPNQQSVNNAVAGKVNDAREAMNEAVTLGYTGTNYSWGVQGGLPHTFANKPEPQNVRWVCAEHGTHSGMSGINADCRLTTLEYEFSGSKMWADDSVSYDFYLTGLVGVKSNKFMDGGGWSYVFENDSAYCAYRCAYGIDWNLWGQPQLMDNPDDLDLGKMAVEGVDGKQGSLEELRSQMHLDENDMNGRLMLVVENINPNSDTAGEMSEAAGLPDAAVLSSLLYEIDFARICQKTIVKTGQKLRLSVGFPAGFDASMAGITFKAYHFTRNDAGEIISVEELPITVTPYGLVILCDSFSPFQIVALDSKAIGEEPSTDKTVMVLAEEGGSILRSDGTVAAGANGLVTLREGEFVTLKVQPNEGQTLSAVLFDGHEIPVSADGTVVIAYEDIGSASCFLTASFVSAAVQQADEDAGMTAVVPDVSNEASSEVSERLETAPGTAPGEETHEIVNPFVDVAEDAYYYDAVLWAYGSGLVSGMSETEFWPESNCTRGHMATFLWRMAGRPTPERTENPFEDVEDEAYYYDAILWAYGSGLVSGMSETEFWPESNCTRGHMATFLWRMAGRPTPERTENPFVDVEADAYYYDAVLWAYGSGLVSGMSETEFWPESNCTRGQMATFLHRYLTKWVQKAEGTR